MGNPEEDLIDLNINGQDLIVSTIQENLTETAQEQWMKTRMSHSQLFAFKEEKEKEKIPLTQIVPKELHKYLDTVFSEREVGRLPPRTKYDHAIDLKEGFKPK